MGKRPMKDFLGHHLKEPLIPISSIVEYYPITAKDQVPNPSIWIVFSGFFLGYAFFAGVFGWVTY